MRDFNGYTKKQVTAKLTKSFEIEIRRGWNETETYGYIVYVKKGRSSVTCHFGWNSVVIDEDICTRKGEVELRGDATDWTRLRATLNRRLNKANDYRKKMVDRKNQYHQEALDASRIVEKFVYHQVHVNHHNDIVIGGKFHIKPRNINEAKQRVEWNGLYIKFKNLEDFVSCLD